MSHMQTGEVVRIIEKRGFGFIRGEDSKEYFFHKDDFNGHWNDLVADFLEESQTIKVRFIGRDSPKGRRADDVKRMDFPNQAG